MGADAFEIKVLGDDECWTLLRQATVGRVAMCIEGRPAIFPVNYALRGRFIVFRTASGTKLDATRARPTAFEIDGFDPQRREAWSVVVGGTADEITDVDELDDARGLPLFPWHVGPKAHFVRIPVEEISGRRFRTPYASSSPAI